MLLLIVVYYVMTIILQVKLSNVMNCIPLCRAKKVIEATHKGTQKKYFRRTKAGKVTLRYDVFLSLIKSCESAAKVVKDSYRGCSTMRCCS